MDKRLLVFGVLFLISFMWLCLFAYPSYEKLAVYNSIKLESKAAAFMAEGGGQINVYSSTGNVTNYGGSVNVTVDAKSVRYINLNFFGTLSITLVSLATVINLFFKGVKKKAV
jgi:hypothetical protein